MAAFICRMCGAPLELPAGTRTCKCKSCGVFQSVPFIDDEDKAECCKNAERLRREGRYDKALELFKGLIKLSPFDADLYWAVTLSRYGVDFSDGKLKLHNAPAKSLLSDEDYKTALKLADEKQRPLMENAAARIDELRRRMSRADNDCDVFLYCKESSAGEKLCGKLSAAGYGVFCGIADESAALAALNSAKVMIVICENESDYNNELVCGFATTGKTIIPVVRGTAENLPVELQKLQAADMSRLGWENDILSGLAVLFGRSAAENVPSKSANPMLRRIYIMLEDSDWQGAERIAAQLLEKEKSNPKICAEVYLAKLLCEYKLSSEKALETLAEDFTGSENYRRAMQLGDEGFRIHLRGHIVSGG